MDDDFWAGAENLHHSLATRQPERDGVFRTFFGTADQPNKPSRVTFQVARLVNPALLIEIEAQAAKAPSKAPGKHKKH